MLCWVNTNKRKFNIQRWHLNYQKNDFNTIKLNETQFLFNFIQVFKSIRLLLIIRKCCSNLPNSDLLFIMYYSFKQFYSLDYSEHKLWLIMTERVPTDSGSSISVKCKFLIRFFSFILQQFSSIMTFYTYCSNMALCNIRFWRFFCSFG